VDLVGEGYDVGVRIGVLPDSSLIAHRVALMELVTCCSPDYLRRRGAPAIPAELKLHDCLLYGTSGTWNGLTHAGQAQAVAVTGRLCANNGEVIRDAAIAGLGYAQLPSFILGEAIQRGQLQTVLDDYRPPPSVSTPSTPATPAFAGRARLADFMRSTFAHRSALPVRGKAELASGRGRGRKLRAVHVGNGEFTQQAYSEEGRLESAFPFCYRRLPKQLGHAIHARGLAAGELEHAGVNRP